MFHLQIKYHLLLRVEGAYVNFNHGIHEGLLDDDVFVRRLKKREKAITDYSWQLSPLKKSDFVDMFRQLFFLFFARTVLSYCNVWKYGLEVGLDPIFEELLVPFFVKIL